MSAVITSFTLMFAVFVSADQKTITAECGQDVTLTCRAPNSINKIIVVEWSRADLEPQHVLLQQNGQFDLENQHPSFKNRVDLQDRQMKDGDASLILKDVMINDTGTYDCRVQRQRESLSLITSVYLHADPPGQSGWKVGVSVSAVLLVVAVVGFLIYRKHKQQQRQRPDELQPV
ncbi:programmed cell death 1 ligand 1 [Maylandia zebra]|uniref:programmed cell death 1 ligand 1 n=1 Tax=Maylandia zebra TaxID=106582 RepID=UPI00403C1612